MAIGIIENTGKSRMISNFKLRDFLRDIRGICGKNIVLVSTCDNQSVRYVFRLNLFQPDRVSDDGRNGGTDCIPVSQYRLFINISSCFRSFLSPPGAYCADIQYYNFPLLAKEGWPG